MKELVRDNAYNLLILLMKSFDIDNEVFSQQRDDRFYAIHAPKRRLYVLARGWK